MDGLTIGSRPVHTTLFFWNFQKCKADLCYILIDKHMLKKVFCSNTAPSLSSSFPVTMHKAPGTWKFKACCSSRNTTRSIHIRGLQYLLGACHLSCLKRFEDCLAQVICATINSCTNEGFHDYLQHRS